MSKIQHIVLVFAASALIAITTVATLHLLAGNPLSRLHRQGSRALKVVLVLALVVLAYVDVVSRLFLGGGLAAGIFLISKKASIARRAAGVLLALDVSCYVAHEVHLRLALHWLGQRSCSFLRTTTRTQIELSSLPLTQFEFTTIRSISIWGDSVLGLRASSDQLRWVRYRTGTLFLFYRPDNTVRILSDGRCLVETYPASSFPIPGAD